MENKAQMEKYLFEVNLSLKGKTLRTESNLIVGNYLGKYVEFNLNTPKEVIIREAQRIKESILTLNNDISVEIDVRYFSEIARVWEGLYIVRNNEVIEC